MPPAKFTKVKFTGATGHLADVFRLKGVEFHKDKVVEVPAELAGLALRSAPKDTIVVVEGEPIHEPVVPPALKAQKRLYEDFMERVPRDGAALLEGVGALPAEVLKLVRGVKEADAVLAVEQKKIPREHLAMLSLWARLGGLDALAKAAARAHLQPTS